MTNLFTKAEIIQILSVLVSLVIGVISTIIAVKTLRQNHKMIEETSRPYVMIYLGITNFQSPTAYLIVKNFGKSAAHITGISCDYDLSMISLDENHIPFSHLVKTTLAPGQSIRYIVNLMTTIKENDVLNFNLQYESEFKKYSEKCTINPASEADAPYARAATDEHELIIISYALQDIAEKLL